MKKTLLLLFCFLSINVYSQKWCPPGAEWFYGTSYDTGGSAHKLTYEKDTIISNKLCNKINGIKKNFSYGPPGYPVTYTISNYESPIFTYAQNDTVFILNENKFEPVYFFNANIGDTLKFGKVDCPDNPEILQRVTSKGYLIVNGDSLKTYIVKFFKVDPDIVYPYELTIVEKFGALKTFMYPYFFCGTDGEYISLSCYKDNEIGMFPINPNNSCSDFTSTEEVKEPTLIISPNPAVNIIKIKVSNNEQLETIKVFNMHGVEVLNCKTGNQASSELNLESLPSGLYIIQVALNIGVVYVRKFMKN